MTSLDAPEHVERGAAAGADAYIVKVASIRTTCCTPWDGSCERSLRRLRVLVVDDSAVHREILTRVLVRDPQLEVAGYASNGEEAFGRHQLQPDVVTLDERMPIMDGFEAARRIMREAPTPIVMVTSMGGERGREVADEALAAGVLAVQDKRALGHTEAAAASELIRVVKGMAGVRWCAVDARRGRPAT